MLAGFNRGTLANPEFQKPGIAEEGIKQYIVSSITTDFEGSGKFENVPLGKYFLVGFLLNRIPSYKTYTRMPGYDLIATNPERNRVARIQVNSRWATGASGFLIKSFISDFVVVVKLNRGRMNVRGVVTAPEYFVFPTAVVQKVCRTNSWSKAYFKDIDRCDDYRDGWPMIAEFLTRD